MKKREPPKKTLRQLKTHIHNGMIFDGIIRDLGLHAWAVYSVIAVFAHWETGVSYITQKVIMDLTGIKSRNTVKKYVALLEQNGYLTDELIRLESQAGDLYGRKRHVYVLTWPANAPYLKG